MTTLPALSGMFAPALDHGAQFLTPKWKAFASLLPNLATQEDALILSDCEDEIAALPIGRIRTILESLRTTRAADVTEGRELVEEEAMEDDAYRAFLATWNRYRDEVVDSFASRHNRRRAM